MQKLPFLTLVLTFFCYQVNAQYVPKKGDHPKMDSPYHQNKTRNRLYDDTEKIYDLIAFMRLQILSAQLGHKNINNKNKFLEKGFVPVFFDDLLIMDIDSLKSVSLRHIESITIDYNSRRFGVNSEFGVIEIKSYKKKED